MRMAVRLPVIGRLYPIQVTQRDEAALLVEVPAEVSARLRAGPFRYQWTAPVHESDLGPLAVLLMTLAGPRHQAPVMVVFALDAVGLELIALGQQRGAAADRP